VYWLTLSVVGFVLVAHKVDSVSPVAIHDSYLAAFALPSIFVIVFEFVNHVSKSVASPALTII